MRREDCVGSGERVGVVGGELTEGARRPAEYGRHVVTDPFRVASGRHAERLRVHLGDGRRYAGSDHRQPEADLPAGVTADDLAVTLLAALQGGLLLAQVQRDTGPLETAVDTVLAFAWDG